MDTVQEIEAAERKMNVARDAPLRYIESRELIDPEWHRRLLGRLKRAEAEFLKSMHDSK
jgi:hypothetical protein